MKLYEEGDGNKNIPVARRRMNGGKVERKWSKDESKDVVHDEKSGIKWRIMGIGTRNIVTGQPRQTYI